MNRAAARRWGWALLAAALAGLALAQGAKVSSPVDTPPSALKPGEFIWSPNAVPAGPLVVVISLDEQLAYVYRNGLRIGVSTVSTGKKGHETPTGVFTILQKHKDHRSSLYDDAPMPFMQRLTWDGVALHAGHLPGYPASHGCVRLPYEFARQLFDVTSNGMTVVVASEARKNPELAHPGLFAPTTGAALGVAADVPGLTWAEAYRWTPEAATEGPLTLLVSTSDQRVLVIRNGVEIGRARVGITGDAPFGTQAYVLLAGYGSGPSAVVPGRPARLWQSIPLPGYAARPGSDIDPEALRRVSVSPDFAERVYDLLQPGTTLVITDASIQPRTTGQNMTVITAEAPAEGEDGSKPPPAPPPPAH